MIERAISAPTFLFTLAMCVAVAIPSAPRASAAAVSATVDCSSDDVSASNPITAASGDTLTITVSGSCTYLEVGSGVSSNITFTKGDSTTGTGDASSSPFTYSATQTSPQSSSAAASFNSNTTIVTQVQMTVSGSGSVYLFRGFQYNCTSSTTCSNTGKQFSIWLGGGGGGGGGGGSSSSNSGCEVAGKPCAVRPWPWPIAYTDYINVSWEALIPAEAGTGGVTAYRVESTPAGGTCLLRTIDLADGEELPTNCNITGLEPDTDYTFTVYASSAYGEGPGRSTQEAVRLLAAATPAVTVPAVTPETPAPTLPATGQHTVLVGAAVLLIGLGALATLSARRRRDLSQMAQAVPHP